MATDTEELERVYSPKVPPAPVGVQKKVRIAHLLEMKKLGRPVSMITAYDSTMGALADEAGVDVILVGDSVGNVMHGMETTLPVTMEMMILHTRAVVSTAKRALVVSDMPFMSYQVSDAQAVENAGRLMKEAGAGAVKLETCSERSISAIKAITDAGVPVMGHIGLTPQAVHALSGYKVQGRDEERAAELLDYARRIEAAGAFAIVLEMIPRPVADEITRALSIPTIGIGAGAGCDGQVLVINDMLGLVENPPRFVKKYADLRAGVLRAIRKYSRDVRERTFPADENTYE